jgi:tetratricopeptide (TPR) repeat protein
VLQEALALATEARVSHEVAAYAGNLVGILRESGDTEEALQLARRALSGHREAGNRAGEIASCNEIGLVLHSLGRPREAIASYEAGLQMATDGGTDLRHAQLLTHLGSACLDDGQLERGRQAVKLALQVTRELDLHGHEPTCRRTLAQIELADGQVDAARAQLAAAIVAARRLGTALALSPLLRDLSSLLLALGQPEAAVRCLASAEAHRASQEPPLQRYRHQRGRLVAALGAEACARAFAEGAATSLGVALDQAERALRDA